MRSLPRLALASLVLASCAAGQPFVDSAPQALIQSNPELRALEPAQDQAALEPILRLMGQHLHSLFNDFINVSIAEQVHGLRYEPARSLWADHTDSYRYIVRVHPFEEVRAPAATKRSFLLANGFVAMLADLLPDSQSRSRFRLLGRIPESGHPAHLLAFLTKDGKRQGLVWVDVETRRILRLRVDSLQPPAGETYTRFTRDVRYIEVNFPELDSTVWLPALAAVDLRIPNADLHSVHRFSGYMLEGSVNDADASRRKMGAGGPSPPPPAPDDPYEVLYKGFAALEAGNPGKAIPLLDAARQMLPGRSEISNYLAAARNQLQAGPSAGMLKLDAPGAIQVSVRQVLVPVVVTYKDGHHVFGLTKSDFHVFEDGVEQKITAFSSERADIPEGENADLPVIPVTHGPSASTAPQIRHCYLICLDLLHASFGNFVYVRDALEKLFRQERAGNSEYAVMAVGESTEIIQNITTNPGDVLESLGGENFRTIFRKSAKSMSEAQVGAYEHHLVDVRVACDSHEPDCDSLKQGLPGQANAFTEYERFSAAQFFSQLRSLVEQLGRTPGRRTLVLISDGFLLTPGEVPFDLLHAYFPEFTLLRSIERISNLIDPIYRIAAQANVMIYTIGSRGLYTPPALDASRSGGGQATTRVNATWDRIARDQQLTLSELAATTGGISFLNRNDILAGLEQAFADGRDYYMLAYVPANSAADGTFRKIDVRVRDAKAQVNAKRGYWATAQ
jgi:VWFA-related protein